MENVEPKFRKFNIHIEPNEAAVAKSGNIDALHDFMTELINDTLDEDITILVVRIPDELELDQETSNDIEVVMAYLREEFATQSPKIFVLGSLFSREYSLIVGALYPLPTTFVVPSFSTL